MLDTMDKSIAIAKSGKLPFPRLPFVYMDDVWGIMRYPRSGLRSAGNDNETPENLFDVLPFRESDISEEEFKPYVVMTYLPDGIYHQMKRACNKAGVQLITKPGTKLKDILCAPNRTHHDPHKKPGVYKLQCSCSDKATYIGQTIRPISTRGKEHHQATQKGNWSHSGIAQHKENCDAPVEWQPEVVKNMSNKNK